MSGAVVHNGTGRIKLSVHRIKRGETLVIEGPARVVVDDGELTLIGANIQQEDELIVKKSRQIALEAITDSTLKISLGAGAHIDLLNTSTIPLEWKNLADTLKNHCLPFRVVFLGDVDTGKTTFSQYLANLVCQEGITTGILSTDVGQGMPGLVSLYVLDGPLIDLNDVSPVDAFFVGSTSPNCFEHRVMVGTQKMLKKAKKLGIKALLTDTTGWIHGYKARELKNSLLQLIEPQILITIEKEDELEHLIRPFLNWDQMKIYRMPVPQQIRHRDRTDRKFLRESILARQLTDSNTITFHFNEIGFVNTFLNTGEIVSDALSEHIHEIIGYIPKYIEKCQDVLLILEDLERPLYDGMIEKLQEEFRITIQIIDEKTIENVLVGLVDPQNTFLGYGIITNVDYAKQFITIYTPVMKQKIAAIQFGSLKVTQSAQEICWIQPWSF